ncbi:putative C2H2 type zinc finger (2 copies) [Trypanosoma vivax]|uniref:C2H2-type domain-containing protein n=1 Tax=Trypanosoma vivax (strain Y486) TaxID=1055687 RepID=G0TWZ5_TRYVY|nr:hypothetical protein TRVL_04456 [Trypanosoma vivax]KAH8613915.1 putative C2H2 type zinc finger (2 copies) [Trypanosoma vivax]CCC48484.1 conserved hypothetical protein [Trypanosoma vivax Y486]
MADIYRLRTLCNMVMERHKTDRQKDFRCIICRQILRGQASVMEHCKLSHGVTIAHFDNIADLDGFLTELGSLLVPDECENLYCPVCRFVCSDQAALEVHIRENGHTQWDAKMIPSLAQFCIGLPAEGEQEETEEEAEEYNGDADHGSGDEGLDGEWDEEPVVCLFCDTLSTDCLAHMKNEHSVDFQTSMRIHKGVHDVYDVIRVVNVIRKCVARGTCPHHYQGNSTEAELCARDIAQSSLHDHLARHPEHSIPLIVPTGDKELIPLIAGDAFISSIVISGDLILNESHSRQDAMEEVEDYPMVPTVLELARRKMQGMDYSTTQK